MVAAPPLLTSFRWSLRYLCKALAHKWHVLRVGVALEVPLWRLLVHDLSKFGPKELPHYGRNFFGDKGDPEGFAHAWNHHQKVNDHHWQHWVLLRGSGVEGRPDGVALDMPEMVVREMVADWAAASRAYEGAWPTKGWPWLVQNLDKMVLSPRTRERVLELVEGQGWI